jgi:hypothetical protein
MLSLGTAFAHLFSLRAKLSELYFVCIDKVMLPEHFHRVKTVAT